jgi:hypothetical protein
MWSNKKRILIVALAGMAVGQLCWARVPVRTARAGRTRDNSSHPTAVELLDKYAQTQDKLKSVIIKSEISEQGYSPRSGRVGQFVFSELRLDGERNCLRTRKHVNPRGLPIGEDHRWVRLWDGQTYFGLDPSDLRIRTGEEGRDYAADTAGGPGNRGSEVMGYFYGDIRPEERVDRVLRQAPSIRLRDRLERVGRSRCYVIEALTERGRYTLWIDPQHGYNMAYASSSNVRFKKIQDVWVLMEADCKNDGEGINGKGWNKLHYKRTEVILNPDHEALGSFVPDVEDGKEVEDLADFMEEDEGPGPDPFFRWLNSAIFVAGPRQGRVVRFQPEKGLYPVVKTLGGFEDFVRDFGLNVKPEQWKDKRLLLYFFDAGEKASQQLITTLKNSKKKLAENEVETFLLEIKGLGGTEFQSWVQSNNVGFPAGGFYAYFEGMDKDDKRTGIAKRADEFRLAWGIKELPWLILADRNHVVAAEGFSLGELDKRIKDAQQAEVVTNKIAHLASEDEEDSSTAAVGGHGLAGGGSKD